MITRACRYFFLVALLTNPATGGAMDDLKQGPPGRDEAGFRIQNLPKKKTDCQEITEMVQGFFGVVIKGILLGVLVCGAVAWFNGDLSAGQLRLK